MVEIYAYQSVMDDVRSKGQGQIARHLSSNPGMKNVIEKQLDNVQSSYNSLLNTALQIKVSKIPFFKIIAVIYSNFSVFYL